MTTGEHLVHADAAGATFAIDAELELPERPAFVPELLVAPHGADGVLVAGSHELELLSGRSARHILRRVIPRLDGTVTLSDLAEALPDLSQKTIRDCVALLHSRGLLEDGAAPRDHVGRRHPDLLAFLGRFNDVTRCNRNRWQAFDRVASTPVRVEGPSGAVDIMSDLLATSGVPLVTFAGAHGRPPGLTVKISYGSSPWTEIDAADRGKVILIRLGAREFQIGPLIQAGTTICEACVHRVYPHPAGEPDSLFEELALGVASHLILSAVCLTFSLNLHRRLYRYRIGNSGEVGSDFLVTPQIPGCYDCGIAGERWDTTDTRMLPWIFHSCTTLAPRATLSLRDHQNHYLPANLALTSSRNVLLQSGHPAILPEAKTLSDVSVRQCFDTQAPELLTLEVLAALLHVMGGERAGMEGTKRRVAPTGGNLGSVRLWILVRQIEGLAPGLYLYEPTDHTLRRYGSFDEERLAASLRIEGGRPACVIVGSGDLARCAQKYRDFAYRVVHFDAGVALAYGALASRALKIPAIEYPDFDLNLLAPFGVPFAREHPLPTFAIGVGPTDKLHSGPRPAGTKPAHRPLSPDAYSSNAVDQMIHVAVHSHYGHCEDARRLPVRSHDEPPSALYNAIYERRSIREFDACPPDAELLRGLVDTAMCSLSRRRAAGGPPVHVRPLLMVQADQPSLASGVYDIGEEGDLVRRSPFPIGAAQQCFLQRSLASSPAVLVIFADLRAALTVHGVRGYCNQLMYAGTALGAAWLAATAEGLVGCIAAGVIPSGFQDVAGLDGFNECPLLALHLGHSPGRTTQDAPP